MRLKELQKKVKRKMPEEDKKKLIAGLRQEILRICPFDYRPESDAAYIRQQQARNKEDRKRLRAKGYKGELKGYPDYPENDLSKIDDENLTKQELLENLGCMIMQELFTHPFRFLRLRMLNAREVWRRENKKAKDEGKPLPYPDANPGPETKEERNERCFGICENQNRKF